MEREREFWKGLLKDSYWINPRVSFFKTSPSTVLGGDTDFENEKKAGGGEGKGLNTIKHHLVGWFDWLEGHELIDEDTHGRLCGFESGEGDGEGKWEEVRKKFETK